MVCEHCSFEDKETIFRKNEIDQISLDLATDEQNALFLPVILKKFDLLK